MSNRPTVKGNDILDAQKKLNFDTISLLYTKIKTPKILITIKDKKSYLYLYRKYQNSGRSDG